MIDSIVGFLTRTFGTASDRLVKTYRRRVELINAQEPEVRRLTDAQLRARTQQFRDRIQNGERVSAMIVEIMAVAREAMDRAVGIRNILDPELEFNPSRLGPAARKLYDDAVAQAAALEPVEDLGAAVATPGWMQVDLPVELYEAVRELYPESRPPFRTRPFDVQLIGGMVLGEGRIAEMKTGEGKTIVAPLACYVACIEGLQCHVVTVNDYLVQRDRDWVFPFYRLLGLTVGAIHPIHMQSAADKARAYECDVVYGTNSEFGFDYLRDNMKLSAREQVQKQRGFCIIDEVDSILIDEARTPLIISGAAHDDAPRYELADQLARHLIQRQKDWNAGDQKVQRHIMRIKGLEGEIRNSRDKARSQQMRDEIKKLEAELPELEEARDQFQQYYEVEREKKAAHLTHDGIAEAQKVANAGSFYVGDNMDMPHLLENALRAHAIYTRDKEYVVQEGEVIIVDEFTGRLMVGRQWSDGLHQAIETKEKVKVKQETQTMATVTIQNFFKLYDRLAGMTGTAATEGTEFAEIYKLEVVAIPTNVPVIRKDYNDLIYMGEDYKWGAIIDEIEEVHALGRPVLVGTASVESSEKLSAMLTRSKSIRHEVLNAKQHEREAHIVEDAGTLGAVTIATNMAGRGTDIKLQPIDRAALVKHWQMRSILPAQARPEMSDQELVGLAYGELAKTDLGMSAEQIKAASTEALRLALMRHWVEKFGWVVGWPNFRWWKLHLWFRSPVWHKPGRIASLDAATCEYVLDQIPMFTRHRIRVFQHIEELGGLHIVGSERHESRRIDNQLRGRAGRQGDRGSSRFFISLEDDLMKNITNNTVLNVLSKLGLKEGDAIEHAWVTRSVEKAQRRVEERNYELRKNLLEYDETMEVQRSSFYGLRQNVLESRGIRELVLDYIEEVIAEACDRYLSNDYTATQVAEWCRQNLDVSVDPAKIRLEDLDDLSGIVRREARAEAKGLIDLNVGEFIGDDIPVEDWDTRSLAQWAMSRFKVDLKQNQIRQMNVEEIKETLGEAAGKQIDAQDISGLSKFLEPNYARQDLVEWFTNHFDLPLELSDIVDLDVDDVPVAMLEKAQVAYQEREILYPVSFTLDYVFQSAQQDGQAAAAYLVQWANHRFGLDWTVETVMSRSRQDLEEELRDLQREWRDGDRLEQVVDQAIREHGDDPEKLAAWAAERFDETVNQDAIRAADRDDRRTLLIDAGREMLRGELTYLERYVLLQILDTAWKDHLYAMDQLRDAVGLRGYAERDPRIEYKREGSRQFSQMQATVRDRVTQLIFKARLTMQTRARSVYGEGEARHDQASEAGGAAPRPQAGTAEQQADLRAAERAGAAEERRMTRRQRRAAARDKGDGDGSAGAEEQTATAGRKRRKRRSR